LHDSGTVSATDDERLPPGGYSLRHGFPGWFGRASKSTSNSRQTSAQYLQTPGKGPGSVSSADHDTPESGVSVTPGLTAFGEGGKPRVSTFAVLKYIRSTFDDEDVLDSVQLEAAGNTGAWHAWKTYRVGVANEKALAQAKEEEDAWHDGLNEEEIKEKKKQRSSKIDPPLISPTRKPGEWNWEGVWEVRAKKGIDASVSEAVLYGNLSTADDLVCDIFLLLRYPLIDGCYR
jgi:hypothetical protein